MVQDESVLAMCQTHAAQLPDFFTTLAFKAGDIVFHRGAAADALFFIQHGSVGLYRDSHAAPDRPVRPAGGCVRPA